MTHSLSDAIPKHMYILGHVRNLSPMYYGLFGWVVYKNGGCNNKMSRGLSVWQDLDYFGIQLDKMNDRTILSKRE
ncbi:hypothetical protein Hanom_Chr16g01519591 [Helianthus anomalus]